MQMLAGHDNLEAELCEIMASLGGEIVEKRTQQAVLHTPDEKEVFFLGIYEAREKILASGYPAAALAGLLRETAQIKDARYPVSFVNNFQLVFRKP